MITIVNGRPAGTKEMGCALCGGTWGNYYDTIDGEELFFCCDLCAKAFKNTIEEVKKRTGFDKVDYIDLKGNFYKGRTCEARRKEKSYKFYVKFSDDADITEFREL